MSLMRKCGLKEFEDASICSSPEMLIARQVDARLKGSWWTQVFNFTIFSKFTISIILSEAK